MNYVQGLDDGTVLKEDGLYFFLVRREGWCNGHPQRVRMHYKKARRLAVLVDTDVFYDQDQSFPFVGECKAGTQMALIYGTRKATGEIAP